MKKILITITLLSSLFSCKVSREMISYEFTQKERATSHWESHRFVSLVLVDSAKFTIQIIDGSFYGNVPILDTSNIEGIYKKSRKGYQLTSTTDRKVKFKLSGYKNIVSLKGTYYNRKTLSYAKINNTSVW